MPTVSLSSLLLTPTRKNAELRAANFILLAQEN